MRSEITMKKYAEMTKNELQIEIESLQDQKKNVEFESQLAILDSKISFALAFTLSPEDFPPGLYKVEGHSHPMQVTYLNGVMAWGTMEGQEVSFPISLLKAIV
jgi:hypothetical protein